MANALRNAKIQFQIAPIILVNGIASSIPGSAVSILAVTGPTLLQGPQGTNLLNALVSADSAIAGTFYAGGSGANLGNFVNLDNAFGAFNVLSGGTLSVNTVPKYPLGDMTMAANAIVREPINISLIWDTPMRDDNAWAVKIAVFQMLKGVLDLHNNSGGVYSIMTPAYTYDNCILTALTDNSRSNSPVPQNAWKFDFERPMVVTTDDLAQAQNIFMNHMTQGLPTTGATAGGLVSSDSSVPSLSPTPGNSALITSPFLTGTPTVST
jgi:hypothetical protein